MAIPLNPGPEDKIVVLSRLKLDRDLFEALAEMAKKQERTIAQQVRWVLKDWFASKSCLERDADAVQSAQKYQALLDTQNIK